MKLNNFAAVDHTLDRTGLKNVAKIDRELWEEYWRDLDRLARVSELIAETISNAEEPSTELRDRITELEDQYDEALTQEHQRRLGQNFFRKTLLGNYGCRCAVCQLPHESLLDAAHIVPWSESEDTKLRLDPTNGIALCKIHHAGFDEDLLRIHPENFRVEIDTDVKQCDAEATMKMFNAYDGNEIELPEKFPPKSELLRRRFGKAS
ncbi:MAG: HNH endonuclease [Bradymonadaceae bacterium]